ncbi:MAG: nucleoside-diphosphate kinase [Chloroflexi bacterium]|nr:nucleoside-diphosphate kinase [Chloroflexota bacterium]
MATQSYYERTLVLLKPDSVQRGLIGQILARFENAGLKIIALKIVRPPREFIARHYPNTPDWIRGMGEKSLDNYKALGKDPVKEVGSADAMAIGELVKNWNIDYLASGPIVAVALEGGHAIKVVRKLVGHTLPVEAAPGTIRGDFSTASSTIANALRHSIHNMIHASGNAEEAAYEIKHWFSDAELMEYARGGEDVMF